MPPGGLCGRRSVAVAGLEVIYLSQPVRYGPRLSASHGAQGRQQTPFSPTLPDRRQQSVVCVLI